MANRRFQDVQALQREVKIIAGKVSSNPAVALPLGVASVALDTSTNPDSLVVTLEDKYNDLYSASAHLAAASSVTAVQKIAFSNNNKVTLTSASGDFANAEEVYLTLFLKNTSVTK